MKEYYRSPLLITNLSAVLCIQVFSLYGPVQTEEGWRIRNNELEKLMRGEDINT
jgi:hypothetical protein